MNYAQLALTLQHYFNDLTMKIFKFTLLSVAFLALTSSAYPQAGKDNNGEVVKLTTKGFIEKVYDYKNNKDRFVFEGNLPCIIDFYADWCAPCKIVEPILKDLAKEYKGKINFYKINIDNERALASHFGIRSIPTYFFIPAKGEPQYMLGAQPREFFVEVIKELLLK